MKHVCTRKPSQTVAESRRERLSRTSQGRVDPSRPSPAGVSMRCPAGSARPNTSVGYRKCVTVVQTLLVLAVIPAAIYGLISLLVLWPSFNRVRYRAGQDWDFAPVFWVSNPGDFRPVSALGKDEDRETVQNPQPDTASGGASGNW